MKTITNFLFVGLVLLSSLFAQAQNNNSLCNSSIRFCTGVQYSYPASINTGAAETGPDYGCLATQPNPSWFYLKVDQSGDFVLNLTSSMDIDFACWGPFLEPFTPCTALLTASCDTCPNNTTGTSAYPYGNLVDCSYDPAPTETCHIVGANSGEYYIVMITNFANTPGNIVFEQINLGQTGAGATDCAPAGNVEGNVFWDVNNNGIKDLGESGLINSLVGSASCDFYFSANDTGFYNIPICYSPDTVRAYFNSPYTVINPAYQYVPEGTTDANFGVTFTENINDLQVFLTNNTPPIPGFDYSVTMTARNYGTTQLNATLKLVKDTALDYISANPAPVSINGDTLSWDLLAFGQFENQTFHIVFHVDSLVPLDQPMLTFANINPILGDTMPSDNTDSLNVIVVGSFDPNDKQVFPTGTLDNQAVADGQKLTYTIRFQNTGTYQATTIKVIDSLSNWLDIPSFDFISSSHPCTWKITGNGNVEFVFNNINLPDVNSNEVESHGFVKFSIQCKPSLATGGNVLNKGYIYFDFNAPIITNTTVNTVKPTTTAIPSIKDVAKQDILISPNPATDYAKIKFNTSVKEIVTLEVIDANGKVMMVKEIKSTENETILNTSKLSKGNYIVRLKGNKLNKTGQLIVN